MRVLIVDDHAEVRELVERALVRDGHVVQLADSIHAARRVLEMHDVDIVVLDVGLPDGSGMDLCKDLRQTGFCMPILLLTAQGAVSRRVEGFDAGADDFLAKPFAVAELRARVRALGRRGAMPQSLHVQSGTGQLDFAARKAYANSVEVPLTAREWAVLELLAIRRGRVVSRGEILDHIWGDISDAVSASLDVIVGRIRRKLGDNVIRTVRGEGYSLGEG